LCEARQLDLEIENVSAEYYQCTVRIDVNCVD
jgi:hypothetical protein